MYIYQQRNKGYNMSEQTATVLNLIPKLTKKAQNEIKELYVCLESASNTFGDDHESVKDIAKRMEKRAEMLLEYKKIA